MVYSDIPTKSMDDALDSLMASFKCSDSTARDLLGEIRGAHLQGTFGQPIYPWMVPNDLPMLILTLHLDSRFDEVDRAALGTLMYEAWEEGSKEWTG